MLAVWNASMVRDVVSTGVSPFPYLEYYKALAVVRGAEGGVRYAEAFAVPLLARRRRLTLLGT